MKHILSLQSHVAYGHVGNCAATFPLQRLGHEVWQLPTVLYSNHKGYGAFGGDVVPLSLLTDMRDSLLDQGRFDRCDAIVSGYLGNAVLAKFVAETVTLARQANPGLLYICDPVMGDVGKGLYVPETLLPCYQQILLPLADIVIPNLFELQLLSGKDITNEKSTRAALQHLGVPIAIATSLPFYGFDRIGMMAVDHQQALIIETPLIPLDFTPGGAGDTTAALFAGYHLRDMALADTLAATATGIHHIFQETARQNDQEMAIVTGANALPDLPGRFTSKAI